MKLTVNTNALVKDWLSQLPDGYREQALINYEKYNKKYHLNSWTRTARGIGTALTCFKWGETPQGYDYWSKIHEWSYILNVELPELWVDPNSKPSIQEVREALNSGGIALLKKYRPCDHVEYEELSGANWGKCYSCGRTFLITNLGEVRKIALEFDKVIKELKTLLSLDMTMTFTRSKEIERTSGKCKPGLHTKHCTCYPWLNS